jgi:WD40 repeat protein
MQLNDTAPPLHPYKTFYRTSDSTSYLTSWISDLSFNSDGQTVATNRKNGSILVWDLQTGSFNQWSGHDAPVWTVRFNPTGQIHGRRQPRSNGAPMGCADSSMFAGAAGA